jgi:ribonuclease BN (tRNA processing enzyme)
MRLRVLGSGTIIPMRGRKPTTLLVEWNGETVLLDCGPGALDAIEEPGRSYREVRRIFLTHYHPDHTLDLGRLMAALNNDELYPENARIALYGPEGLEDFLDGWRRLYPGTVPKRNLFESIEVTGGVVLAGGSASISAAQVIHGGMPALAYRIEEGGGAIAYTGDTGYDASLVELARGADLLVSECSFPDGRDEEGHLTPSLVGRIAAEAAVERVLLVHLYPVQFRHPSSAAIVRDSVRRYFDGQVEIAEDGLEIEVDGN